MVKSRYIGDGHPTFNRNLYNGYINPYYWVDDHPLLYGNNGSLDPSTHIFVVFTTLMDLNPVQTRLFMKPKQLYRAIIACLWQERVAPKHRAAYVQNG